MADPDTPVGACRSMTTAHCTKNSYSTVFRPGCRGSPYCASENFRRAFDDFEPAKIARYNAKKDQALINDVRHRSPIAPRSRAHSVAQILSEDDGRRPRLLEIPVGFCRRQAEGQSVQDHGQRAGVDAAVDQDIEGAGGARDSNCRPTIVYAFVQATGLVNDHLVDLLPARKAAPVTSHAAPQSQMTAGKIPEIMTSTRVWQRSCRGGGSTWTPRRWISKSPHIAHGLARVARWN